MRWLIGSQGLANAANVTLRMLQWWDEQGIVSPQIEGHRRLYSAEAALLVVVIAELRRHCVTLNEIRLAVENIQRGLKRESKRLADCYLVLEPTRGTVIVSANPAAIPASQAALGKLMLTIDLGPVVARLPANPTLDKESAA